MIFCAWVLSLTLVHARTRPLLCRSGLGRRARFSPAVIDPGQCETSHHSETAKPANTSLKRTSSVRLCLASKVNTKNKAKPASPRGSVTTSIHLSIGYCLGPKWDGAVDGDHKVAGFDRLERLAHAEVDDIARSPPELDHAYPR